MKVLEVEWISGRSTIGIILAENGVGEKHVYVSAVPGHDEDEDVQYILDWGAKMDPAMFKYRFEKFME